MHKFAVLLAAGSLALSACAGPVAAAEEPVNAPAAARVAKEKPGLKTAIFAGGCFWGVEGVFSHVKGVTSAVSGYHGGNAASAKYDLVSSGVRFRDLDTEQTSLEEIFVSLVRPK